MKVGFIGTGNMGSALAKAVRRASGDIEIYLADFFCEKRDALAKEISAQVGNNLDLVRECDFVFLGVKPQVLPEVLKEIAPAVRDRGNALTLISMAAGVKIAAILEGLSAPCSVIRIMPNTPVAVEKGVVVYCSENTSDEREAAFKAILSRAGVVEKIPEDKIDAASALHGCGPAFVYLFIEALADGAVLCGLSRDQALRFAAATVAGAGQMVLESGEHPGKLKDAVCSPGGTTIVGVHALEEAGFRGAAMDAVAAAYERTVELGK